MTHGLPADPVAAPEAYYRRLSTPALETIRAELIAVHTQRHAPMSPELLAEMRAAFPHLEIAEPETDPEPQVEPFFVNRIACIDRILAERRCRRRLIPDLWMNELPRPNSHRP